MRIRSLILCVALVWSSGSLAQGSPMTGTHYRAMGESYRGLYVYGVVEGLKASWEFTQAPATLAFSNCVSGMSGEQERTIVDRYMESHRQFWNLNASALVLQSFREICPDFAALFDVQGVKSAP
jgi:hypothetical protein